MNNEEFEIKFLEVDVPALEKKLLEIGAEKVGEYDYEITTFDYPDYRLNDKHSWIRLRTDGFDTTLTYKERIGVKSSDGSLPDDGMKEIKIKVDNFKNARELMFAIGLIVKHEAKRKRIRYKRDDIVFDIDFWPQIPPYIEIESTSLQKARDAAGELGFNGEQGLICSSKQIYKKYGFDIAEYSSITPEGMVKK
jgi:adenylate cyclase class 2